MARRDIVIVILVIAAVLGYSYWRRNSQPQMTVEEESSGETLSTESQIESAFNVDIPDDVDKAELSAVNNGTGSGIATRSFEANTFRHNVLADLDDPPSGAFYQGWLVRGEEGGDNYSIRPTGQMRVAKGGFVLEFSGSGDLSDHGRVLITLERVNDQTPETRVLEGNF